MLFRSEAEERPQLDLGAPRHGADAAVGIDRNVGQSVVGEVLGQGSGEGTHGVPAPVGAELDVEHLDRQRIAALGPLDIDRPRQNMAAQMRRQLAQDFKVLGQDVHGRLRQDLPTARYAMDSGDVARLD